MKICLSVATSDRTGVETVVSTLARGLLRRGIDITVLTLSHGPLVESLKNDVKCFTIPVKAKTDVRAVPELISFLCREKFSIVHTHGARASLFVGLGACFANVSIRIATIHQHSDAPNELSHFRSFLENLCYRSLFAKCITVSNSVLSDAILNRHLSGLNMTRIYNSVKSIPSFSQLDSDSCGAIEKDRFIIGTVGRLETVKGHRYVIEAMPEILRRFPFCQLKIAGTGSLADELKRLAFSLGLVNHVTFCGQMADLKPFYSELSALVVPSISEAFGLVVVEAMRQRVPIIATKVGGMPEIIKMEENGLLVPPKSAEGIAAAVIRLLGDKQLRARLTMNGVTASEQFSEERFISEHLLLYSSLAREMAC